MTSEVHDSIPTFQIWYGSETKEYDNVDDVIYDKFFDGKSIKDLLDSIEFTFA